MIFGKKFVIGLIIFLIFAAGNISAQVCGAGGCEAGENCNNCFGDCPCPGGPGDCQWSLLLDWHCTVAPPPPPPGTAGLCESCTDTADCSTGLTCEDGKCRGCPCDPGEICFCNPVHACAFDELIDKVVDFIFYIALAVGPFMFLIAGFYFVTAAGDAKRIATAKTIIIWTLVGMFIVLMSKGIIGVIRALF
ncbi:hypothetical protein KAR26_00025 [Candidatus Parcubacteria bacterium]|nr:hypothetical protein [Candidatus Parcubacteria bacterium]